MQKRTCKGCNLLGTAATYEVCWHVCKHGAFKEMFIQGRALDLNEYPEWCPKKPKSIEVGKLPTELFDKKDLDITTSRDDSTGVCTAFVLHKPTGTAVKVNEYKSMHKNVNAALVRLHARLIDD